MRIDEKWTVLREGDQTESFPLLLPAWHNDQMTAAQAIASVRPRSDNGMWDANVWESFHEAAERIDLGSFPDESAAKAACVRMLRSMGFTFKDDPTVVELNDRLTVLETVVASLVDEVRRLRGSA